VAAARQTQLTVLDASALLALLLDEPGRADAEALMRRRPPPLMSAANLAEVIDKLVRGRGANPEQVNDAIDLLIVGGLEIVPFWLHQARNAAALRARFYDRASSPLSLADCACLATALSQHAAIATTDPALAQAAADLGVQVIPLPDSTGQPPAGR
jgi:PIN domain nuclease of toxin-antitoxin system